MKNAHPSGAPLEPAKANDTKSPEDSRPARERICYPRELKEKERGAVLARRKKIDPEDKSHAQAQDEVGLALSGGGIRSATFCLGVLQALADDKRKVLRRVDYLSTVSGGGYAGSFLGRLFTRRWVHEPKEKLETEKEPEPVPTTGQPESITAFWRKQAAWQCEHQGWKALAPVSNVIEEGDVPADRVEKILDDHQSKPMVWLRESGRYLAPTGGSDTMLDIAVAFRNWAAVTVVTVSLLFTILLLVATVRALLWKYVPGWHDHIEGTLIARTDTHWWWSPWLLLPCFVFCFFTLPFGCAYWLTQKQRRSSHATSPPGAFPHLLQKLARPWLPVTLILIVSSGLAAGGLSKKINIPLRGIIAACLVAAASALTLFYYWCARRKVVDEKSPKPIEKYFPQIRNRLSKALTVWFGVTIGMLLFAMVDSFGQMAYAMLNLKNGPGVKSFLSVTGLLVLFTMAQRIKLLLDQLPDRKATKVPLSIIASLAALVLGGGLLVALSGVSHALAWQRQNPGISVVTNVAYGAVTNTTLPGTNLVAQFNGPRVQLTKDSLIEVADPKIDDGNPYVLNMNPWWTGIPAFACLILTFFFGHTLTFLNLSSHSTLYADRLTRAYHGASNPRRWSGPGQKLGDAMPFDDLLWREYKPHAYGGPLHIVSTTLNETVGGKSQVEDRDRHGMMLALGPIGITVGARFHALWKEQDETKCATDLVEAIPSTPHKDGKSIGYHPLHHGNKTKPPHSTEEDKSFQGAEEKQNHEAMNGQDVESLWLSQWIGISGAAFSTGLGKGTSIGTSLIAGMANVRLGYWWDSHMKPEERGEETIKGSRWQMGWSRALPVQAHLFDEFLAQFRGPNNRLWYLSDGGHFENTGAYELIRRRVPYIIICDCGADPDYKFEDLAALVRMVRVDFGAEVEFLRPTEACGELVGMDSKLFGLPEDFQPAVRAKKLEKNSDSDDSDKPDPMKGPHALFATVTYPDNEGNPQPQPGSYLIILKPSVSGDEPLDVLYYQSANPRFPQEPTSDQDFDEAQWESYRKLGRHIGEQVFPEKTASVDPLGFTKLLATKKS